MSEAAVAYVSVVPSATGFGQKLAADIDGQGVGARVGDSVGKSFLGKVGSIAGGAAKILGGTIGATASAIGGIALGKGLSRALDIQDAQKKLSGLGHSAASVTKIMNNALASVKGTAFGLGDAATVAASAVAAGIKPGKELTSYLKLTADTATIAGTSLGDMGSILNQATASGKVYTDTLNQLSDRGVPVFQYLQKEYGVTADGLTDMVKKGQVSAATLDKVLQEHLAGSALKSGETARGAFANVGAALGRLGVQFGAGTAVEKAPALFTAISNAVDRAAKAFNPLSDVLNGGLSSGFDRLTAFINGIDFTAVAVQAKVVFGNVASFVQQAVAGIRSFAGGVKNGGLSDQFASIGRSITILRPAFASFAAEVPKLGPALATVASSGIQILAAALGFLADHIDQIIAAMPLIVSALLLWKGATTGVLAANRLLTATQLAALPVNTLNNALRLAAARTELQVASATAASTGAQNLGIIATVRAGAAAVAARVAIIASAVATGAATAAQWLFNAALSANPIGIIIIAIAAVVAALIWFFTQTKLGQQIWTGFVTFLTNAWNTIVTVAQTVFSAVAGFVQKYGLLILAAVAPVIGIPILIATHWNQIVGIVSRVWNAVVGFVVSGVARVVGAIGTVNARIVSVFTSIGSTLYNAGKAIIQNFINGITAMTGAVGNAVGGVMKFIEGFFPHSPAQRGPFSGSGWRQVGESGAALADQFSAGFNTSLSVSPITTSGTGNAGRVRIPATVTATTAGSASQPIYTDHGVLFGMIQQGADGVARLILNQQNAAEQTTQRLGYQPLVFG